MKMPGNPPRKELQEKDFTQDSLRKNPFPFWIWLVILTSLIAIFWGSGNWYSNFINQEVAKSPFLQLTNRQFSIFLWQFPEYMRINAKSKQGYLTGFQYQENKINMVLSDADKYVVAPPDLLFLYHTWQRLISQEFTPRAIPSDEFKEFLAYAEEWQPRYWPEAPKPYVALVQDLAKNASVQDLNEQSEDILPILVRQSFQGWKNYFKEGDAINSINPTYAEMQQFIKEKPHYARNYWRNIVEVQYPMYLKSIKQQKQNDIMPRNEIAPFLRVAYYNFFEARKKIIPVTPSN